MSDLSTELNEVLDFKGSSTNDNVNASTTDSSAETEPTTIISNEPEPEPIVEVKGLTDSNEEVEEIPTDSTTDDSGGETDMSDINTENTEVQSTDDNEKLPRLVIRDEDSIWQFGYKPAKYDGSYHSSECTYKRIFMPEGYVKEENIIDDYNYTPAVLA